MASGNVTKYTDDILEFPTIKATCNMIDSVTCTDWLHHHCTTRDNRNIIWAKSTGVCGIHV